MGKAKTRAGAGKALTAAEQRQAADFLAGAHARMELWRACKRKACRRRQSCCGGNVDECGARCAPKAWEWVHRLLQAMREGNSRRAAVRAADRAVPRERERIVYKFGFGDPPDVVVWRKDDGTFGQIDGEPPPTEVARLTRPLTAAGAPWLRGAPLAPRRRHGSRCGYKK
jgi:hypothetical protein